MKLHVMEYSHAKKKKPNVFINVKTTLSDFIRDTFASLKFRSAPVARSCSSNLLSPAAAASCNGVRTIVGWKNKIKCKLNKGINNFFICVLFKFKMFGFKIHPY